MNLCKSGFINARTKSLREKFSRHRSYSELSFKESATTSSLVSTPTESCSGSLTAIHQENSSSANNMGMTSRSQLALRRPAVSDGMAFYSNDPYCSALDLSTVGGPIDGSGYEAPQRFPWQRDAAVQCDLLASTPLVCPILPNSSSSTLLGSKKSLKKHSSSSTSSAASTLINAAAATLRHLNVTENKENSNNKFWKSSLLLPPLNLGASITESHHLEEFQPSDTNLRRQKSSRWASASMVRRPMLKRAASFDSRGGYARLVQSISSPNSPTDNEFYLQMPHSAILSTGYQGGESQFPFDEGLGSTMLMANATMNTAMAPMRHSKSNVRINSPEFVPFPTHRKISSNEMREMRRRQFIETNRRQPSSAPNSFDDDSIFSPMSATSEQMLCHSERQRSRNSFGDAELYNFNTVNRLLNISLTATNNPPTEGNTLIKPFLLELPDSNQCHPNLPSPNMQSDIQDVNPVLRKLSVLAKAPHKALGARLSDSCADQRSRSFLDFEYYEDEDETLSEEPPVSEFQRRRRRRALVPPKLITDGYESANEYESKCKFMSDADLAPKATLLSPIDPIEVLKNVSEPRTPTSPKIKKQESICSSTQGITCIPEETQSANDSPVPVSISPVARLSVSPERKSPTGSTDSERIGTISASHTPPASGSHLLAPTMNKNARRRSSVVVIPPMQICPGDLLVYSKVLTQRSNMIDSLEGNSTSGASGSTAGVSSMGTMVSENENRKHKNTWSLLRLFDRSQSRNKAATDQILCGLEEVLASLAPTTSFIDESMLRFRSIGWTDFLAQQEERRISNASSLVSATSSLITTASAAAAGAASAAVGLGCSRFFQGARFGSLQTSQFESGQGGLSTGSGPAALGGGIACKKISLPTGGLARTMASNFERLRPKHSVQQAPTNFLDVNGHYRSKSLQRAESCNTVSDVESINEQLDTFREAPPMLGSAGQADSFVDDGGTSMGANTTLSSTTSSRRESRRREALWELFQSDLCFLTEHLMVLKNVFMEPLKKIQVEGYAMFAEPEVLFGNLDELIFVTYAFCQQFLNILTTQIQSNELQVTQVLAKLFQNNQRAQALTQAYHRYTLNYINALNYLETLRRQVEFAEFEKWCNRDARCKKLQLPDLLVAPVQHVMRVPLLLKEIETRSVDTAEKNIVQAIIQEQEHSLRELDDKMRWLKNFERLLDIQRRIIWPSILDLDPKIFVPEFLKSLLTKQPCERLIVSPRRQIVLEGPLMVLDSGKPVEMYVFLFDDLFLITRRKKGLGKKQSTLTERWVSNCSGRTSSFSSVVGVGSSGGVSGTPTNSGTGGPNAAGSGNASAAVTNAANVTINSGEPVHGAAAASSSATAGLFKYVVYKQPLSLDRFYIHEVLPANAEASSNLKNVFVLVCLNRFQQVVTVHTFQASSESSKNTWVSKLRESSDRWKRTLQSSVFRNSNGTASNDKTKATTTATTPSAPPISATNRLGVRTSFKRTSPPRHQLAQQNQQNSSSISSSSGKYHCVPVPTSNPTLNSQSSSSTSNSNSNSSIPQTQAQPVPAPSTEGRMSTGSAFSMASSLRDNASCSYMFDDSILTASTMT